MDTDTPEKKAARQLKIVKLPERAVVGKNKGSPKAQRTAARLAAVQVMYQMKLNNQEAASALREFITHRIGFNLDGDVFVPADTDLLESIVLGVNERWDDVERVLSSALAAGKKTDVETLLDCILRAGAYELLASTKVDTGVIINDYLNVTAGFYEGSEPKLVNAILDNIAKAVRS